MCGLVGLISKKKDLPFYARDVFTSMLIFDSIRGPDSTGVIGLTTKNEIDMVKGNADGYVFTKCAQYTRFRENIWSKYSAVFGHNRKATIGTVNSHNAHPFREKHITLMHNGTLRNAKDLNSEVEVDSHAITHALAEHDAEAALAMLNGAFALIWHDAEKKTINLARNSERPLALIEYDTHYAISSEAGLALWLHAREGKNAVKAIQVPTEKIISFNLTNLESPYEEIEYSNYKAYVPPAAPASTSYSFPHQRSASTYTPSSSKESGATIHELNPKKSDKPFAAGDMIKFRIVDYKEEDNEDHIVIGHPIIDNELYETMWIRCVLFRDDSILQYVDESKIWEGRVQSFQRIAGQPTILVGPNITEIRHVTVRGGISHQIDQEFINVLSNGCTSCGKPLSLVEAPHSIVQKKQNRWRVVCKECIAKSVDKANEERVREANASR